MNKGKVVMAIAGVILVALIGAWSIVGYLDTRTIEEPSYVVVSKTRAYEVRRYAPLIRAEVVIDGGYRSSLYGGFRKLADYIFGNNTARADIAMTAPVLAEKSQKIAMTAPVLHEQQEGEGRYTIAFVMPSEYTLDTLPKPNNDEVSLREVPETVYAVHRFGGYATEGRTRRRIKKFEKALARDGLTWSGAPQVAQYNPPWTPPYMRRNEIMLRVKRAG